MTSSCSLSEAPLDDSLQQDARSAGAEIRSGSLRGDALIERILAVPWMERDAWIDVAIGMPEAPPDEPGLPRGAVPYLPAGVDEIIAVVREAPLGAGDTFIDLGSGLGRVAILAHLFSGVSARGVEIQLPLVLLARERAAALALSEVSFVHADAATAALDASVFFFYSPFTAEVLRRVLLRLKALSAQRPITLCAVGLELPDESWLSRRGSPLPSLVLYDSHPR